MDGVGLGGAAIWREMMANLDKRMPQGPPEISVEEEGLYCTAGVVAADTVTAMMQEARDSGATCLVLSQVTLGDGAIATLGKELAAGSPVIHLAIADSQLPMEQLQALMQTLSDVDRLEGLEFTGMAFGEEELAPVSQFLRDTNQLSHLSIEDATMADLEIRILAHGLSQNETLTHLSIAGNSLGHRSQDGVKALVAAVKDHPGIVALNMNSNALSNTAVRWISSLMEIEGMEAIWMRDNPRINDKAAKYLSQALENAAESFEELDLGDTSISADVRDELLDLVEDTGIHLAFQSEMDLDEDSEDEKGFVDWRNMED